MLKLDIFNKEIQSSDQRFDTVNIFTSGEQVNFDSRPTVNGTGIFLSGDNGYLPFNYVLGDTNLVTITQSNNAPVQTVDIVSDGVQLTRGSYGVLYNPLEDNVGTENPYNTEWNDDGWSDLSNITGRTYVNLLDTAGYENFGAVIVGKQLIMHDITTDKYHKVLFSAWQQNAGHNSNYRGFSYARTELDYKQEVSGLVNFTTRPTVNGTGIVLNGEIDLSNYYTNDNLSGFITGVDLSNYYTNDNLSGFITGVDLSNYYTNDNLSGFITGFSNLEYTSGDLTGQLLSPTINKIQGYNINLSTAPLAGQTLQWNGTNWIAGAIPVGGNGGGGRVYYFDFANQTGIAPTGGLSTTGDYGLSLLGRDYAIGSGQVISNELDPRYVERLLCSFVTASGDPQVTNIPAGLWDFNIWASVNNQSTTQCSIRAEVNIYNTNNSTYRYLASTDDVYLYETDTIAQYILNATVPKTGIASHERIYIKLFGKKYTTNNRNITIYFDSYRPSHVHTTIPFVVGSTPTTSTSIGTAGDMRYDNNYLYICTATNTWRRTLITGNW
jgi:hypothetical protein